MTTSHSNRSILIFAITITAVTIVVILGNLIYNILTQSSNILNPSIIIILTLVSLAFGMALVFSKLRERRILQQSKKSERILKGQEVLSALVGQEQAHQTDIQKVELEKRKEQIELEARWLDLEAKRLEIREKSLELEKERVDYVLEVTSKMIDTLEPNVDRETKEIFIRALFSKLLQSENGKELELASPAVQSNEEKITRP